MGKRKDEFFKENYGFNKDFGLLLYKYRKQNNLSQIYRCLKKNTKSLNFLCLSTIKILNHNPNNK